MHQIDIHLEKDIYEANNRLADANAAHLRDHGVRAFDLLGAIGSGKTSLIERLVPLIRERGLRAGAIAGDVYGDDDFQRIVALGIPAYNANTGKECHLDAHLVEHALEQMPIVVVSSTEGDDVVNKHPMMFRGGDIGVINKIDLAPFVGANLDRMESDIRRYNPGMKVFRTNLKTGDGLEGLLDTILE